MSTSKQTFDQVKSILGKLDRFIDDARARRLDGGAAEAGPAPAAVAGAGGGGAAGAVPVPSGNGMAQRAVAAPAQPMRATPNYGRGFAK